MIRTSKAHAFSKTKAPISALLLLAILAVSVRVASIYFLHIPARYSIDASGYLTFDGAQPDDREYEGRAWNLVSGGNFWSLPNGDGNAPPGYPLVIAGLYAVFGRRLVIVLALNAVLGGLAAIGTYLLSRRLMEHRAALLAGLFVCVDPILLFWSGRLLTESLTVFVTVLMLHQAVAVRESLRLRQAILLGVTMGAAVLIRNQQVAVGAAVAIWLLWTMRKQRRGWQLVGGVAVSALLIIIPVNALAIAQRPAGTRSQFEQVADGKWVSARSYIELQTEKARYEKGSALTTDERSEIESAAAMHLRSVPEWRVLLENVVERLRVFWRIVPGAGGRVESFIYALAAAVLFGTAALGILFWIRAQYRSRAIDTGTGLLLVLTILTVTALHAVVLAKARYRLPLHPILWIWAAYAVGAILRRQSSSLSVTQPAMATELPRHAN